MITVREHQRREPQKPEDNDDAKSMKLTGNEAIAFEAWKECDVDYSVISFATVSHQTGLHISKVRRAVRGLARKGLVEFIRVSWTDEGVPHGAGYGLTKRGNEARKGRPEA